MLSGVDPFPLQSPDVAANYYWKRNSVFTRLVLHVLGARCSAWLTRYGSLLLLVLRTHHQQTRNDSLYPCRSIRAHGALGPHAPSPHGQRSDPAKDVAKAGM